MAVTQTWAEPSTLDLADNDIVGESHWDSILSILLYLGRVVEISLTNKSGGALAAGDVVILDSTNDNAVTTTATASLTGVKGVAMEAIAINAAGRIAMAGKVTVATTGTVNRGDYLETSAVAGKAQSAGTSPTGKTFARASTAASGGSCTAVVLPASADSTAPANLIAYFNGAVASIPSGWTEFTAARGRVIVGVPLSGTVGGSVGAAATDLEALARSHTHTGPSHQHEMGFQLDSDYTFQWNRTDPYGTGASFTRDSQITGGTSGAASVPSSLVATSGTGATGATSATMPFYQLPTISKN